VTPLEMATGYQVFQNGGGRTEPYLVSEIRTTRGDLIFAHATSAPTPVLDPLYATRMVSMLKGVITGGTGTSAGIGRPAAGKTGTSQDWRDAWFVGFTPDLLTAVWVGNDNGAPMAKVTGGELPAAIWHRFMSVAEKDLPSRDFPWLVPEPPGEPPLQTVSEEETGAGAYQDEPAVSGPGGDMGADDDRTYQPPPNEDDRAEVDSGDGRGPVVIRGGHVSNGTQRGYYDGDPDAPPPGRAQPDRAQPERGWREQPPDYERDDEAPPPRAPADSSADDDPRYRY
jgi:membrane peptidoglycan carboxypeptidase